jgi:hypothetical protein
MEGLKSQSLKSRHPASRNRPVENSFWLVLRGGILAAPRRIAETEGEIFITDLQTAVTKTRTVWRGR